MNQFAWLEKPIPVRSQKQHYEDVLRECCKHKLKHLADDSEQLQDRCRDLIRSGADVTEELKELTGIGNALLLVALLLKREQAAE